MDTEKLELRIVETAFEKDLKVYEVTNSILRTWPKEYKRIDIVRQVWTLIDRGALSVDPEWRVTVV